MSIKENGPGLLLKNDNHGFLFISTKFLEISKSYRSIGN